MWAVRRPKATFSVGCCTARFFEIEPLGALPVVLMRFCEASSHRRSSIRTCVILLARLFLLRGLHFSPQTNEGAERRQALGCSGTHWRASDVGPQARARRLASNNVGRSPLGAPLRGLWRPAPRDIRRRRAFEHHASFSRPLVVAEGGFPLPPGSCLQGNARDTASRPAYAMPRESTLGGRNVRTICLGKPVSKIFGAVHSETVDMLFTVKRVARQKCPCRNAF
jgi:hypothetical protein